jgi:hypothetical protein
MQQPMQHESSVHRQRRSQGAAAPPSPPRPSQLRQRRSRLLTAQPQQSDEPGRSAKHPPLPTYVSKLRARARYCALHAWADAHGRATDCAVGPPAAAAAASAASVAPIEPSPSTAPQPASPVRPPSACRCTRPAACAARASTRERARCGRQCGAACGRGDGRVRGAREAAGLAAGLDCAKSAPGLGSPLPHVTGTGLAHVHIFAGAGLAPSVPYPH